MSSKTSGAAGGAVLATVALAAILRFIGLGSSLWYDEIVTLVDSVRLPFLDIVTRFPGVNTHPFYSVLAHLSVSLFGESSWALRLPACLFGVGCVWMAYVLGETALGHLESWAGALVLATSYHHIWFSQNARGYSMMGFFALLSTWYLLRAVSGGRRVDHVGYALACAAGIYTHLTMAFVVAGHVAVILVGYAAGWRPVRERMRDGLLPIWWTWVAGGVVSLALYAPFIPGLLLHLGENRPVETAKVATGSWALAEAIRSVLSGAGVPAAIAGGAVAFLGALSLWRRSPLLFALLVVPAFVTAAAVIGLQQPLRPRFFFFLSGAAAIFVGRGLGALADALGARLRSGTAPAASTLTAGLAILLATGSVAALPRNYDLPKQDFDGAVRYLEAAERAGAKVASAGPACWPLEFYYGKKAAWPCLASLDDLRSFTAQSSRALVVITLTDYIVDASLRQALTKGCPPAQTFPGTLGGGDLVVCDAHQVEGL
ncbi:MAG: glycosyltransferase family 39 protein [Vicinamibacterales bacterium]